MRALSLCAAAAICLTATGAPAGALGDEVINGVAYPTAASLVLFLCAKYLEPE